MNRKRILLSLTFLAVAAVFFGYYWYNKPMDKLGGLKSMYKLSAKELYQEFDSNEDLATKKYQEKVVEVSGKIDTTSTNETGGLTIILSTEGEMGSISCEMDMNSKTIKTSFIRGEQITLKGMCAGKLIDVVLNRCVIK
ncbi:MAG: hypothetical protein ABIO44_10565 [Saprospiraceae bacterium]